MGKNKKDNSNLPLYALLLLMIVSIGGIGYAVLNTGFGGGGASGQCEIAPTLDPNLVNALARSSNISPTVYTRVNGNPAVTWSSSDTFSKGDNIEVMVSLTNYLDKTLPGLRAGCGVNRIDGEMYATSTNTFRIFDTNNNLLTDGATGGATNQTASASPLSFQAYIDSTSDESTGDLVVVIEADNTSEVDNIVLSGFPGAKKVNVPEFYSVSAANSIAKAYEVSQVLDGASVAGTITLSPETGITMDHTAVYVTAYSKQWFVDTDGSYKYGVEDSDGTAKYEDTWDYDFYIE